MRVDIKKSTLVTFLLIAMCSTYACSQEATNQIRLKSGEITFSDPEQSSWRKVFYSNKDISQQLFPGENAYFDGSDASDLSKDKSYLKINKIIRGVVQEGDSEEEYERMYCAFIDMASGCIVRQETGSFCGGEWANEGNMWIWAGEKILVDEIDRRKALSDTDIERLSEIGGEENISRCARQQ